MINFATPLSRTATLAALLGSLAVAGCSDYGQNDKMQSAAPQQNAVQNNQAQNDWAQNNAAQNATSHGSKHHHAEVNGMKDVEARIQTLHDKLKITPDQESEWSNVADTMRDNESQLSELIKARHANPDSMTAIDDLQSYQRITQAHADGMQKMVAAFTPLYNDMSDAQKKNADEVFGRFEGHRDHMKKHHHKK